MKDMRIRAAALALLAACTLCLAGCDASGGKPRIGVALFNVDDELVSTVRRSLESAAAGKAALSVQDGQNKKAVQDAQIEAIIAEKARALIVNPVDPASMGAMVFRAKAAGVPIVFFSRDPSTVSLSMWDKAYFVGVDTVEADALQVQILAEYWRSHPEADKDGDGRVKYVLLGGGSNAKASKERLDRLQSAFDAAGLDAVLVAKTNADWTRVDARQKMNALMQVQGSKWIEAVVCSNDEMALGAIEALKTAGYFKGGSGFVPVVGIDGTRFALEAIGEGSLLGTASADARSQGRAAFDLAYALARGEDPASASWKLTEGKIVLVPYRKVTRENYAGFLN
jgi:methyl-galactoside transport system substrate-binding protein